MQVRKVINSRKIILTAGSAKNEIANTEKQEATIFPGQVRGTVSPYPIVVTVIWKQINKHQFLIPWTS